MIPRLQNLKTKQNLLLFGARGTGKSTLLKALFPKKGSLWIDLLDYKQESSLSKNPDRLSFLLKGNSFQRVIIDEIQKIPKLLDIVHKETEKNKKIQFIMTGSSARKLKRGQANLLAGRAIASYLYPLSCFELKKNFNLLKYLQFGALPKLSNLNPRSEKLLFLESYAQTYLKEEILQEQIIRKIQPFKNFLEVTAQINGQILNYSKFSREVGVDHKTIQNYFSVLDDTLLGFFLPAYHRSIRKQQQKSPKFFLFDLGVKKALERTTAIPLKPGTYAFGSAFEHFIILECHKLNHYFRKGYKFSYLKTKDGLEIDLIVQRPGKKDVLVEIKSTTEIREEHTKKLYHISASWDKACKMQVWSRDTQAQTIKKVKCLYWKTGLKTLFSIKSS